MSFVSYFLLPFHGNLIFQNVEYHDNTWVIAIKKGETRRGGWWKEKKTVKHFSIPERLRRMSLAVVRIVSTPCGLFCLDTVMKFESSLPSVSCLTSFCTSLNNTCSVMRFQIRTLPDSVQTMYLQYWLIHMPPQSEKFQTNEVQKSPKHNCKLNLRKLWFSKGAKF